MKSSANLSFLWTFVAFVGGVALLGLPGVIVGPLVFSLFIAYLRAMEVLPPAPGTAPALPGAPFATVGAGEGAPPSGPLRPDPRDVHDDGSGPPWSLRRRGRPPSAAAPPAQGQEEEGPLTPREPRQAGAWYPAEHALVDDCPPRTPRGRRGRVPVRSPPGTSTRRRPAAWWPAGRRSWTSVPPAEYASGHIEGSLNVPVGELEGQLSRIPKDRPVVVYCASGIRSSRAASALKAAGLRGRPRPRRDEPVVTAAGAATEPARASPPAAPAQPPRFFRSSFSLVRASVYTFWEAWTRGSGVLGGAARLHHGGVDRGRGLPHGLGALFTRLLLGGGGGRSRPDRPARRGGPSRGWP
jgi:hypothetical protein